MRRTDREDRRGGWQLFHSISGGGGIHRFGNFQAQTISLRKGAYAFYDRRATMMRAALCSWDVRSYLMNVILSEAKHDNAVYEMALRNQFANERLLLS